MISVKAVRGGSRWKKVLPQICPLNYLLNENTLVSGNTLKIFFESSQNNQSCPFFTSRHRRFQKLTISLLVTHYIQQEIVWTPKFCDIQGVWKAFQFWYVSFQRLAIIYLKHPSDSFLKLVKSILFLSWVIILKSRPDH